MKANATTSNQPTPIKRRSRHDYTFAKVLDRRKQPIRGLWVRNGRFYARLSVEDGNGSKNVRRVPLLNSEGNAVETVAQAVAELNRLRTHRADDKLPVLGRTPTFVAYANAYLAQMRAGRPPRRRNCNRQSLWPPGRDAHQGTSAARELWPSNPGGGMKPAILFHFKKCRRKFTSRLGVSHPSNTRSCFNLFWNGKSQCGLAKNGFKQLQVAW